MALETDTTDLDWFKSSYSPSYGNCVEVAHTTADTFLRDSKNPSDSTLRLAPAEWSALVTLVQGRP